MFWLLFTIYDEGPVSLIHCRPDWQLIARDAFNGAVLWKRPIPSWLTQFYYFRSDPVWLARRLVASGDRVYATLGLTAIHTSSTGGYVVSVSTAFFLATGCCTDRRLPAVASVM